jgi:hypothetical protein
MNKYSTPKYNQAGLDLQHSIDRSFELMEPYLYILESDVGLKAEFDVNFTAMSVALGIANTKDLAHAISQSSSATGIPIEVFSAYAETVKLTIASSIKGV